MDELDGALRDLMFDAMDEAARGGASAVEPIHLLTALLRARRPHAERALVAAGKNPEAVLASARAAGKRGTNEKGPQRISTRVMAVVAMSKERAGSLGRAIDADVVFAIALTRPDRAVRDFIDAEALPVDALVVALIGTPDPRGKSGDVEARGPDARRGAPAAEEPPSPRAREEPAKADKAADAAPANAEPPRPPTPTLDEHGKDYTELARTGKLDPMFGRRKELLEMVRVLLRKQKSNPLLLGEPGVGKTTIVEGLAHLCVAPDAPPELAGLRIVEISMSSLIGGTKYRGELEERLAKVVKEVASDPRLVVFIDEIHTLVETQRHSSQSDAANALKPALARGDMRCIGATTRAEYQMYFEKDAALDRRFQTIVVSEPTEAETKAILVGLRSVYEKHHGVVWSDEAIDAAITLTVRYLPYRRLPDKARDALDQASANKRFLTLSPRPKASEGGAPMEVSRADIAAVVSDWTGTPLDRLDVDEAKRLLSLEDELGRRVIGQPHAVAAVADAVRAARAGVSDARKPRAVFLFTGPSGVGKTELAKALAECLFGDERCLLRFDMSEYMEKHSVSKLIGSPPGYVDSDEGGTLTNAVRRTPYSVLLFDEIEKAHPNVSDIFLQIFDDARLTDARGRPVDFTNTFIVMTSNLGAAPKRRAPRRVGFGAADKAVEEAAPQADLRVALLGYFRPELVNRIGEIVAFHALDHEDVRAIAEKVIDRVRARFRERSVSLVFADAAIDSLVERAMKMDAGARAIEGIIEREIVRPLARRILDSGALGTIEVIAGAAGLELQTSAPSDHESSGPASFVGDAAVVHTSLVPHSDANVALVLVDIVGSTKLVIDAGDTAFSSAVGNLYAAIQSHSEARRLRFLKCTGDGFLMVHEAADGALLLARALAGAGDADRVKIRAVLHAGRVKVGNGGDPLGIEVHRLFRVEAVSEADRVDGPADALPIPTQGLVVATRAAIDVLPQAARAGFGLAGRFTLGGFDEPCELWVHTSL